jgi:hypothetical protein
MARNLPSLAVVAAVSCLVAACGHLTAPRGSPDPETARVVSDDIPRFWSAFDLMTSATDTVPFRTQYLDRGTTGLKDFTNARWKNAKTLTAMVWPIRAYYSSIRQNTLTVQTMEPSLRRVFRMLDTMYDGAIFPDVYFAIGGMSTGGTTSNNGLLIGVEMFSRAPDSPVTVLSPWGQSVVRSIDVLPAIVAHELTHYQQHYSNASSLLAQSIREGSADFVSELLTGQTINDSVHVYGDAHEAAIWHDFSAQMNGTDYSQWLYNGGSVTSTSARPADLGYYVGYKISAAYYAKQADKHRALRDILQISNFPAFLAASGYGPGL